MTICEAIIIGAAVNKAFHSFAWKDGLYAYHGMDNQICFSDGSHFSIAIATLTATDYQLYDAPYHGPLDKCLNQ